ncbi:hypothetical protein DQM68_00075 [Leptospira mayottensis]|nr:hypothetical protein DQM68_00075 [Leptospira mayottensis]AXR66924.1 hypothetical protein DPV73_01705 [Leptospira mayottensis]AZQ01320.1 hypothetical protein LEP1GSC190_03925 [Leptospira mayottensis 200901116]
MSNTRSFKCCVADWNEEIHLEFKIPLKKFELRTGQTYHIEGLFSTRNLLIIKTGFFPFRREKSRSV